MNIIKIFFYKIKLNFQILKNCKKIIDEKYYTKTFIFSKSLHFFFFGSKNNLRPNRNFNLRLFKLDNNLYTNNQFLTLFLRKEVKFNSTDYKKVIQKIRFRKKLFYKNGTCIDNFLKKKHENFIIVGSGKFNLKLLKNIKFKNSKIICINEVSNYLKSDITIAKETPLNLKNESILILSKYLYGDIESKLFNFSKKKFYYFNQFSKVNYSINKQLKLLEKKPKYLINSKNTYLTALHLACVMGAKSIITFGISMDFKYYIKDYYNRKKRNLVPELAKKIYIHQVNKERETFEKYLIHKFKVRIENN